jgi:hypothetical protein
LTSTEAIRTQFSILREAKALPEEESPSHPPPDHSFDTFECRLPPTFNAEPQPDLSAYKSKLVTPPEVPVAPPVKIFTCPFCSTCQQSWAMIDHYWNHLRDPRKHGDEVSIADRLQEVKESGAMYLEWQGSRGYDYSNSNKRIAQMVKQSQLDSFDWETFQNWTFHVRKARLAPVDAGVTQAE